LPVDPQDAWSWDRARRFLPSDLDGLARSTGLLSRLRGTDDAEGLARLLLLCAVPGASLRTASAWGRESGLSRMGACALFLRLRDAEGFLEGCFREALRHAGGASPRPFRGLRLVAVDATVLCGPGAKGPDQRLHTVYDLGSGAARSVDLTGPEGGERLSRHASFGEGDLVLADRGYGHAKGILAGLSSGARLLVRVEFASLRLLDAASGERLSPEAAESRLPQGGLADLAVRLPGSEVPLRALGCRNPEGRAVWLLTDLDGGELRAEEARSLYAERWQVELFFKRMKSLLGLGDLPSRDGPTARPWVWAKLTLAALATLLGDGRFSPCGQGALPLEAVPARRLEGDARPPRREAVPPRKAPAPTRTRTQAARLLEA
jgi:hypothetical protein